MLVGPSRLSPVKFAEGYGDRHRGNEEGVETIILLALLSVSWSLNLD